MTRIFFLPDENTILLLEDPQPADQLLEAVRTGCWAPPAPYSHLCGSLHAERSGALLFITRQSDPNSLDTVLSLRQRQMLESLALGLSNRQIARRLGLSYRTVSYHMNELKTSLGVRSRKNILPQAAALGLIHLKKEP